MFYCVECAIVLHFVLCSLTGQFHVSEDVDL